MPTDLRVHHQFTVSSGSLCYGQVNNIWHGATQPIQEFPLNLRFGTSGSSTALFHDLQHNTVAQNGTWNAFQLVDNRNERVVAWFVCHSETDPRVEIDKILSISGSPYELDSGSSRNTKSTAAANVLVINRYDWDYYDSRGASETGSDIEYDDDYYADIAQNFPYSAVGLVDYKSAKDQVKKWMEIKVSLDKPSPPDGVWLQIPNGEYSFGRFGFNDDRTAARSFLFFTICTEFAYTTFAGQNWTLRLLETDEERFNRLLREGHRFDGLREMKYSLHELSKPPLRLPEESELLGPYDQQEYVIGLKDMETVQTSLSARQARLGQKTYPAEWYVEIAPPFKEECVKLVNEMVLSWLEHFIVPHVATYHDITELAAAVFPRHAIPKDKYSYDRRFYRLVIHPQTYLQIYPGSSFPAEFDRASFGDEIKRFLVARSQPSSLLENGDFFHGLSACIWYLLETLIADTYPERQYPLVVPQDIRASAFRGEAYLSLYAFSRYYWWGDGEVDGPPSDVL